MLAGFHFFSKLLDLTVDVAPGNLTKAGPNGELTSNAATANESGGKSPYSYLWTLVSGDSFTINTNDQKSTDFTTSGSDEFKSGTYKCVVTDDNSDTAEDTVQVNFTFGTPP